MLTFPRGAATVSSITYFIEHLCRDKKLERLDMSMNGIDARAILAVEDALQEHKRLSQLDVSGNPLGNTILFIQPMGSQVGYMFHFVLTSPDLAL